MNAFLDTHAAVALYEGDRGLLGAAAADLAERSALFISPMVRLELQYLREIGRLSIDADKIITSLREDWGVFLSDDPLQAVVDKAMGLSWTHDPFDRLLVATAMLHRAPFITRDRKIRDHFADAVW